MRQDDDKEQQIEELKRIWGTPPGFVGRLSAVNNQNIGTRFMLTAAIFFTLASLMAVFMRVQLAVPENDFLGPEIYNQLFTMHGSTMMYLFVVPFLEGLAIYMLPQTLGSRDMAFPRLSAFSYWVYLFGGLFFFASFLIGQVPGVGWFAYTPLSTERFSGFGVDMWLWGLGMIEFGGIAAGAEIVVTILKLRAPGMSMTRMPLFAWAWLVTGLMILFAFTTLLVASLMLELDRTLGTNFFDPTQGGSTLLWQHLFWFFGHPEVYIMFLPATGMVSMIVPTFARRPIAGYSLIVVSMVVMGFVSFGLWAHHMFTTGIPWLSLAFFTAASLAIALSAGTLIFAWIATLWGTRPKMEVPLLYVLGFILTFVVGGMTGVMVAVVPFDLQVHDTYFVVAHFHYVLIGGVVFPILGGLAYWFSKITGKLFDVKLGLWSFWLIFIGFNVTFFPMHILGFQGMPRRVYTYASELGLQTNNMIATIGSFILVVGLLLYMFGVYWSVKRGEKASGNPFNGGTLEWMGESPIPTYNIYDQPIVDHRYPLWREGPIDEGPPRNQRAAWAISGAHASFRATAVTEVVSGDAQAIQFLAYPTLLPFWTAVGLLVASLGELFKLQLLATVALVFTFICLGAWIWPDRKLVAQLRDRHLELDVEMPVFPTGTRSVAWWGMVSLVAVLGTVFAALFYSYFYIWLYSESWPQGGLPRPNAWAGAGVYALLLASGAPQFLASRAFQADRYGRGKLWLLAAIALGVAFLAAQGHHLSGLGFTAQANAYGSLFYVIHLTLSLVVAGGLVFNASAAWRLRPEPGALAGMFVVQRQMTVMYWYALVVFGALVFATLYVSPYVLG